jgi:hypothetical protein
MTMREAQVPRFIHPCNLLRAGSVWPRCLLRPQCPLLARRMPACLTVAVEPPSNGTVRKTIAVHIPRIARITSA